MKSGIDFAMKKFEEKLQSINQATVMRPILIHACKLLNYLCSRGGPLERAFSYELTKTGVHRRDRGDIRVSRCNRRGGRATICHRMVNDASDKSRSHAALMSVDNIRYSIMTSHHRLYRFRLYTCTRHVSFLKRARN